MTDIQKFRANVYIRTILRPRLAEIGEAQYSAGVWTRLLPRLSLIARGSYDYFPLDEIESAPGAKFLLLLNDVELFEYGAAVGYFDNSSVDSFYVEIWRFLDAFFGEQASEHRKLVNGMFKDVRGNVALLGLEGRSGDQFLRAYSRDQKLYLPETKRFVQIFLVSSEAEWGSHLSILIGLSNAIVSNPLIRLSSTEIEAVCWAFSGAEIMLYDDADKDVVGLTSGPYRNLIERIVNAPYGWIAVRRYALHHARRRISDAVTYLTEDEVVAAIHTLRIDPKQESISREDLRKMIEAQPPTEIG
ncbi:UNVERIFIED_ORG: hypothetical protein M2328_006423 [Rhodococcus erythropolis]